jgi:2-hydroxychromene-2-carboxylate isomerase
MALPSDLEYVTKEGAYMQVEFLLDYRSPYAYLANTQMKALSSVVYTPIDIVAVMNKVNNQPSPLCPPKARYAGLDAGRWAKHYGVAFSPNGALLQAMGTRQFDGALLARAALAAQELGVFGQVNDVLFEAVWAGSDDLVTEEGRSAFLRDRKIAATDLWRLASAPKIVERLAKQSQEAADRDVFGVPTFFVEGEMFFGNDRLNFVQARLRYTSMDGAIV